MKSKLASIKEGSVVYGIHIHRDTTRVLKDHRFKAHVFYCEVEAKRRPFLVIKKLAEERGKIWYLIAPITSKNLDARDQPRKNLMRLGNLFDDTRESYLQLFVEKVPENLISDDGVYCDLIASIEPFAFQQITKTLVQRELGWSHGKHNSK